MNALLSVAKVMGGGGPLALDPIEYQQDQFRFVEGTMQPPCKQSEFTRRGEHGPFG
ncbi:hypothetical protein B0I31_12039 [Saccharothrix carnea]|uniref:Uncharacterized protein n=1 Tax=Saccharothrix carnea TaxID=1280637 RepID=A0A2P8HZ48_SACCR|nr:hypothetical protein [Saccharothrix carnea]PSL51509.1 hypothetical protein B0I31_12039 [Saccharothrix carnea]